MNNARQKPSNQAISRAIWSFWSKPFRLQRSSWLSERHHLLSWVLSVQTARKHFARTALYTDAAGEAMIAKGIGLEFDEVSTCFNDLDGHNPDLWCLGKVQAYSLQKEPFIHIDSDVFMWKPLPDRLLGTQVLAQNSEAFPIHQQAYQPERLESVIRHLGGWLPEELAAYAPRGGMHQAFCCGLFGGCNLDFIRYYAEQALRFVEEPKNRNVWRHMLDRNALNMVFEQYFLAACLEYHRGRKGSPFAGVEIQCLFRDFSDAFQRAGQMGFTHLLGPAKQDPLILARLEKRVQTDYPAFYERCMDYFDRQNEAGTENSAVARGQT